MNDYSEYEYVLRTDAALTSAICAVSLIAMLIAWPLIKKYCDGQTKHERVDRYAMRGIAVGCMIISLILGCYTAWSAHSDIQNHTYATYTGTFVVDDGFVMFTQNGEDHRLSARRVHLPDNTYTGTVVYAETSEVVVEYRVAGWGW